MFNRNQLAHLVIWPNAKTAVVSLIDPDGEAVSEMSVREPIKGSELAKKMADGFAIHTKRCSVVSVSGDIVVRTRIPFDTAVVTERPVISFEDRMARLERRERRRELKAEADAIENEKLRAIVEAQKKTLKENEAVVEEVEQTTEPTPEAAPAAPEAPPAATEAAPAAPKVTDEGVASEK